MLFDLLNCRCLTWRLYNVGKLLPEAAGVSAGLRGHRVEAEGGGAPPPVQRWGPAVGSRCTAPLQQ